MADESTDRSVSGDPGSGGDYRSERDVSDDRSDPHEQLLNSRQARIENWTTVVLHSLTLLVVVSLLVLTVVQRESSAQLAEQRAIERETQTEIIIDRIDGILEEALIHSEAGRVIRAEEHRKVLERIEEVLEEVRALE